MLPPAPSPDFLAAKIEEGAACAAVLSLPAFARVVDDLTNLHTARILAAPVGEAGREERERNHALHTALTEIVQELLMRREVGAQAEEALAQDEDDDE